MPWPTLFAFEPRVTQGLSPNWQGWLQDTLTARREQHLLRVKRPLQSPQGPLVQVEGRWLHNFCSNDYLGLANEPALAETLAHAARTLGVGAGAAGLVCGHHQAHEALAEELADWLGVESVLLFGNGYLANVGVLQALAGKGDAIFQDRLNHASLLDGGLASGAHHQRYVHGDVADLQRRLRDNPARRRLIVSDGVFSMDGDLAPLAELVHCAQQHDALLMLDEAHAFGVLGAQGRGSVDHLGLPANAVPLRIGTLGKAFGVYGAFAAGPKLLMDVLQQTTRTAIYTTALPAALAETTRHALRILRADDWRRERLQTLTAKLRSGLQAQGWTLMDSATPIQPIHMGSSERALALSAALAERGFWVGAIRPPTVPAGTARLRLTLSASHDDAALASLLSAMAELAPEFATEMTT